MKKANNRPETYVKLTYIQKVSRANRKLRRGDVTNVALETDYSVTHVSDVLSGKYFNDKIVNCAFNLTRGRQTNPTKISRLSRA